MASQTNRCHTCGYTTKYWARIERHVDTEHYPGGRIDVLIATR